MRRVILIPIGAIALVAVAVIVRWGLSPRVARTIEPERTVATAVEGAQVTLSPFETPYFASRLPSTVRLLTRNEKAAPPILAQYLFSGNESSSIQVGVTVSEAFPSVSDIPAVKARLADPDGYRLAERLFAPEGSVVLEGRADQYETGIFWQDRSLALSVVVTGTRDQEATLEDLLATLVSNWQWP